MYNSSSIFPRTVNDTIYAVILYFNISSIRITMVCRSHTARVFEVMTLPVHQ